MLESDLIINLFTKFYFARWLFGASVVYGLFRIVRKVFFNN